MLAALEVSVATISNIHEIMLFLDPKVTLDEANSISRSQNLKRRQTFCPLSRVVVHGLTGDCMMT